MGWSSGYTALSNAATGWLVLQKIFVKIPSRRLTGLCGEIAKERVGRCADHGGFRD
jgi:hypothetical protein